MATNLSCPRCGAFVADVAKHDDWHAALLAELTGVPQLGHVDDDDAPTLQLPPIGETVRRRPPVPNVRELRGPELLRALADELDRDGLSVEDLDR